MALTKEKIKYFKEKLEEEKKKLESELGQVGQKNPDVPGDWEVSPAKFDVDTSEEGELSSAFEELENRNAIEDSLEERLLFVNKALEKIKEGKYGICSGDGKDHPIEFKRLEANPAAMECMRHASEKFTL
ncbi:MAG: hypothetical protein HUT38_00070 [Candidatus Paceibacter sp.]|nr:hypothetical protein [Candidatus Paceibacter sp.]